MNRKNISVTTLVVGFLFLHISSSMAQTCAIPPAASDVCIDAPELSCNLDGYTGSTAGFTSTALPSGFCGMVENNQFLSFRADESPVIFRITPASCTNARGIQAMIYDSSNGCNNLVSVSNCGSTGFESTIEVTAPVVIIGRKYHLMIDGFLGDICDYTVEVVRGIQSDVEARIEDTKMCVGTTISLDASESSVGDHVVYTWETSNGGNITDGQNTLTPTIDALGEYTLTVTDTISCCIDQRMITVSEDTNLPQIAATSNDVLNCKNEQVTLTASSEESGDFSYQWVGNDSEFEKLGEPYDLIVNNQSTYSFIATNNQTGCTSREDVLVQLDTVRPQISLSTDGIIDCNNREVNLGVAANSDDVTFVWDGGDISGSTDTNFLIEDAGLYTVTATASNGCTNSLSRNISVDTIQPSIEILVLDELDCTTEEVNVIGNANTSVDFNWSGPNGFSDDSFDLTVNEPGIYEVEITASNGCKNTKTAEVIQDIEVPNIEILPTDTLTCTNSIVLVETTFEDNSISDFSWTFPNGTNTNSPNIFVNEGGNYDLTVMGSNGCTNSVLTTVVQDTISPINEPSVSDKLTCTNLEVNLNNTVLNGSTTYTYQWQDASNNIIGATKEITQNEAGTYKVITTNIDNGCSSTSSIEVQIDTIQPLAVASVQDTLTCSQSMVTLDGSESSIGSNFSYEWRNQNNIIVGNNEIITVGSPETYELLVTNNENGCTSTTNTQVLENRENPIVEITADSILTCAEPSLILKSTQQATSINGTTEFDWKNTNGDIIASNETPEITEQGVYQINVTDRSNGCTTSKSIEIVENKHAPTLEPNTPATLTCSNTTSELSFDSDLPNESLSIQWSNTDNIPVSSNQTFTTEESGDYFLEVTNTENGCSSTELYTVLQNKIAPYADTTLQATLTCINQTVSLDVANSTQGTSILYQWKDMDETTLSESATIEIDNSGSYQLIVTDVENGCTDVAFFDIEENTNPPESKAGEDQILTCDINEVTLGSTTFNAVNISHQWINNEGEVVGNSAALSVNEPDVYQLITTNTDNGCTSSDQVTITENIEQPAFSITQLNELNCYETPVVLETVLEQMEQLYSYEWTNTANEIIGVTQNIEVEQSGAFSLKVTNESNKCVEEKTIQIEENKELPEVIIGSAEVITCSNPQVLVTGSSSSTNNIAFEWKNENNEIQSNSEGLETSISGIYTLNITNLDNGCSNTDEIVIEENTQQPTAEINAETNVLTCSHPELTLVGGTDNDTNNFEWKNENGISLSTENSIEISTIGTYDLVVTNVENGCTQTNFIQINENKTSPTATILTPNEINCINETALVEVEGQDTYSYRWKNENGDAIDAVAGAFETNATGIYELEITDQVNGCTKIQTIQIEADVEAPTAIARVDQELNCVTESVQIDGFDSSTGDQFEYEWNGNAILAGATSLNPAVTEAGEYRLQVTNNENGCTSETSVLVIENTERPTSAIAQINDPICHEDANGIIQIEEVIGGTAPYLFSFEQTDFNTNSNINNLSEGTYSLTIQDAIGCEWDTMYQLISPSEVSVELGEDQRIQLGESIILEAQTTGNIQLIEWESGDGQIEMTTVPVFEVTPTETTTYEIYIEDENGCLDSDFITIQVQKDRNVYIPNAFSPDGDGVNDLFQIYANQDVEQVTTFQVYDRWGNHVFAQNNFSPNDLNHGWDGHFRNQKMQPGVYVYMAEIEFIDGKKELFKGDVTVLY